ncbi:MAG: hypothetical protein J0H55_12715 [Chitinophagaceae bacterium]|nr:hypothetical protein [Chitinophagaceae bacterium]
MSDSSQKIKLLTREEINTSWWNSLILQSNSPLIYAEAEYLDFMCPGWSALIEEKTNTVMPFPVYKKMGIRYALQPPFVQQSGVFTSEKVTEEMLGEFIIEAKRNASLIDLHLNYNNVFLDLPVKTNFVLDLNYPFNEIQNKFRRDLIHKPLNAQVRYFNASQEEVFSFYEMHSLKKTNQNKRDILNFKQLCNFFEKSNRVICKKVISKDNQNLCMALFLRDKKRVYYMLSSSSEKGRETDANAYLLYELIREFSNSDLILDFEGSEIPGVKFFFQKFSPQNQPYPRFLSNRLNTFQKGLVALHHFLG